jgi:hypothetical protein
MQRNLLEEFKEAYTALRLRPIRGFFFIRRDGVDYACPLVAHAMRRGLIEGIDPGVDLPGGGIDCAIEAAERAAKQFGEGWVKGFLDGFDGQPVRTDDPAYSEGFASGEELAEDILPDVEEVRDEQATP